MVMNLLACYNVINYSRSNLKRKLAPPTGPPSSGRSARN